MVVAGKLIKDNSEEVKEQLIRLLQQQGFQVDAQTPQGKGKWRISRQNTMPALSPSM